MKLHQLIDDPGISFSIYQVLNEDGSVAAEIPVVGGWLQLSCQLLQIPNVDQQKVFFNRLNEFIGKLVYQKSLTSWYFIHKYPGLLIRCEVHDETSSLLPDLVSELRSWQWPWLGQLSFDAYFEQKYLLSAYHQSDIHALLQLSSECYIHSVLHDTTCDERQWARFLLDFLLHYLPDPWVCWEALCRFENLRRRFLHPEESHSPSVMLYDPTPMLQQLPGLKPAATGFSASTSLLQTLNYMLNNWALDAPTQIKILELAKQACRPEILPDGSE